MQGLRSFECIGPSQSEQVNPVHKISLAPRREYQYPDKSVVVNKSGRSPMSRVAGGASNGDKEGGARRGAS